MGKRYTYQKSSNIKKIRSYNHVFNESPNLAKEEVIGGGLKKIDTTKTTARLVTPGNLLDPAINFYESTQEIDFYGLIKNLPKRYFYYKGYNGDINEEGLQRIFNEMEVALRDDSGEKVVKIDKDYDYFKIGLVMNHYIPRLETNVEELCGGDYIHLSGKKRFKTVMKESTLLMKEYADESQWIYANNILFFIDRLNVIALEARLI